MALRDKRSDKVNRALWDIWTPIHAASKMYDVDGFRAGKNSLKPIELESLGCVTGKRILHMQCHFGLDTLSLARMGANVIGVDYSPQSIQLARRLSVELNLPAHFIEANIYDLGEVLDETFDIVFASYGVLHWLDDLDRWGRIVAAALRPGGVFHLVDFHPIFNMLSSDGRDLVFPYFATGQPVRSIKKGACTDPDNPIEHEAFEWPHGMAEVLMALIKAGLRIENFREFPHIPFKCLDFLEEVGPDQYAPAHKTFPIPLMFALRATS